MTHTLVRYFRIEILLIVLAWCCNACQTTPSQIPEGVVIGNQQRLIFHNSSCSGYIETLDPFRRRIHLNGNSYDISVKPRTQPVGGMHAVNPRYGVFNPGESFFPHLALSIVYDESIQDYKSPAVGMRELKSALISKNLSGNRFVSNDGLYLMIKGSPAEQRMSLVIRKMTSAGQPVRIPTLQSKGTLVLHQ